MLNNDINSSTVKGFEFHNCIDNSNDFSNFRFLGIGHLSDKQIANREAKGKGEKVQSELDREAEKDAKKEAKRGGTALGTTAETGKITDAFISSQASTDDEKPNYIPYIAVGSIFVLGIVGLVIYKLKQPK